MFVYRLYLGKNVPALGQLAYGGDQVTNEDFNDFIEYASTKLEGFTVLEAEGLWANEHEDTVVIEVIDGDGLDDNIKEVGKEYKELFHQEAVLYTKQEIEAEFL